MGTMIFYSSKEKKKGTIILFYFYFKDLKEPTKEINGRHIQQQQEHFSSS
jgi:hypothetical protein